MNKQNFSIDSKILLNDGNYMPQFGLGLSHQAGYNEKALLYSINLGALLLDTAKRYANEQQIGDLLQKEKIDRSKLFISSKFWPGDLGLHNDIENDIIDACQKSLQRLQTEYLDLYLLHWPARIQNVYSNLSSTEVRQQMWRAMENLKQKGLVRSVGVSNFEIQHLKDIIPYCKIKPVVNQIELNPFQTQVNLRQFCKQNDIVIVGYCPLAKGQAIKDERIMTLANKYETNEASILIRWTLQIGAVAIPASTKIDHLKNNLDVFNIQINEDDMKVMESFNCNLRCTWDPSALP